MSNLKAMSDTKEPKTVDVSALIAGDVQFVQVDVWTEAKGLHMVKLRVVEEVNRISGGHPTKCTNTGEPYDMCSGCGAALPLGTVNYCPGCGNKIKRP